MLFLFFNFHLQQKEEKTKLKIDVLILYFVFNITYVVVQFYPWFKFSFLLFQTHYHTLPYTQIYVLLPYPKTKENIIYTKDKTEPQQYTLQGTRKEGL